MGLWPPDRNLLYPAGAANVKAYIGVAKCCGAISAAMVDDERTKPKDVGRFAKEVLSSGRDFRHVEVPEGTLQLQRCKCSAVPTTPSQSDG